MTADNGCRTVKQLSENRGPLIYEYNNIINQILNYWFEIEFNVHEI